MGGTWSDGPFLKVSHLTPRVVPSSETVRRVLPLAPRIPITRIADISPLDRARVPVFCAVTPLARDLTTHLGKGLTPDDARASAMMEAVERISAEGPADTAITASMARMTAIGHIVSPPRDHDLAPGASWSPDAPLRWVSGDCLLSGDTVWLPADLIEAPPRDGLLPQVDTNGLAAGNTRLEAVLHALCEVIERDAISQLQFAEDFADPGEGPPTRRIDPRTLPDRAAELLERSRADGRQVIIDDLTQDIAVPVMRAMIADPAYPSPAGPGLRVFAGYGCDPNTEIALNRALTEAAQSMLAVVQGARDSFNDIDLPRREAARTAAASALAPARLHDFRAIPSLVTRDLREDLAHVLGALRRAGLPRAIVVDLTRPDLRIPVVRIRIPGTAAFIVDRNRIGWRCLRWLQ